jgi:CheY-like chemotaxis protein
LVVDNEEADRELLVHLLEPLGFEVRVAASGHDALDLLAAGYNPDAVLLDLAMPGIDGWETLRRLRALGLQQVKVAIVSANAFDRGLENDVGITPDDFIVKPLRHSELLDWLEQRLQLVWQDAPAAHAKAPLIPTRAISAASAPPHEDLIALQELLRLGYFRGIMNKLTAISTEQPHCAGFTDHMATLARQYQFEAMLDQLQRMLDAPYPS